MRTRLPRLAPLAAAMLALCACRSSSGAEAWPARPVRLIVPYGAGSGVDLVARLYAPLLSAQWQQAVVVDNRPGGDGSAGVQAFVAAKDGHTLLLAPIGLLTVNPLLHDRLPYDPQRDLEPISAAVGTSVGIAAAKDTSAGSLAELIALARRHPDRYVWTATPGLPEMIFRAFLTLEQLQMKHVAYRDMSAAVHDLNAGRIHVMVAAVATMAVPLEGRAARLLAVTNSTRSPAAPDVPTATEAGYPMLTVDGLFGFFGWREMPTELRLGIAADVRRAGEDPALTSRLATVGLRATTGTPDALAAAIAEQQKQVDKVARVLRLRPPVREGGV